MRPALRARVTIEVANAGGGDGVEEQAVRALLRLDHKPNVVGRALVVGRVAHRRALREEALGLAHEGLNALLGRVGVAQPEAGEGEATLLVQEVEVAGSAVAVMSFLCRASVQALVVTAAVLWIGDVSAQVSCAAVGDAAAALGLVALANVAIEERLFAGAPHGRSSASLGALVEQRAVPGIRDQRLRTALVFAHEARLVTDITRIRGIHAGKRYTVEVLAVRTRKGGRGWLQRVQADVELVAVERVWDGVPRDVSLAGRFALRS